jgi:hypothetical protein
LCKWDLGDNFAERSVKYGDEKMIDGFEIKFYNNEELGLVELDAAGVSVAKNPKNFVNSLQKFFNDPARKVQGVLVCENVENLSALQEFRVESLFWSELTLQTLKHFVEFQKTINGETSNVRNKWSNIGFVLTDSQVIFGDQNLADSPDPQGLGNNPIYSNPKSTY